MKALRVMLPLSAGIAAAASVPVQVKTPTTGLLPSHVNVEFATRMGERHGGSDLSWSSYNITLPFLDPRKSNIGSWAVNAQADLHATLLSAGGDLDLRRNELYSFTLPVSFISPEKAGNSRLVLALAPAVSTDFAGTAHCFDFTAGAFYSEKTGENFSYMAGLAVSPRFAAYGIAPVFNFNWSVSPQWEIALSRYKLSALYQGGGRLRIGPFVSTRGGAWMVDTPAGDRLFRITTLIAGLTGEYDFHQAGERKRVIYASVGSTIATTAGYYRRNFKKDNITVHHYHPGFYASFGVDFRF